MTTGHSGIEVRPLAASDCDAVCELVRENATRFSDAGLAMLPKDAGEFARWVPKSLDASSVQSLKVVYGIFVRERSESGLAGFVGVETLNRFRGTGVWYGLGREVQGRGLAKTGVLAAMSDFSTRAKAQGLGAFKSWVLHVMSKNTRSLHLAESLGFEREELLDYTRSVSARGGVRFSGFSMERTGASLAAEASARIRAFSMGAAMSMPAAANDSEVTPRRRLRA
jgi:RimJ/RimL family protein N-acetyltransferase